MSGVVQEVLNFVMEESQYIIFVVVTRVYQIGLCQGLENDNNFCKSHIYIRIPYPQKLN